MTTENNNINTHSQPTITNATRNNKYIHWGGALEPTMTGTTTRLYYKNLNGIGSQNLSNGFVTLYNHMKQTDTSIGIFVETNVDWKLYAIKKTNEEHGKKLFHNAIFTYSCDQYKCKTPYQPGGTMMLSTGVLASRHLESGTDPSGMGRYSYQKFVGNNGTKLMFIAAYRVCAQSIKNAGDRTSFFHQWHNLLQSGHTKPNPRKKVLDDLKDLVLTSIGGGFDICVSMDANEELDVSKHQLADWVTECGLISVHEHFFNEDFYETNKIPNTFDGGRSKIDHVFCTPRLFTCVDNCAIESSKEGVISDHRALTVDFNTERMLGTTANIAKHATRLLKSKNKKASSQYRSELHYKLMSQNVFARASNIIRTFEKSGIFSTRMHHQAEALDLYITNCMLIAENSIQVYNSEEYSPEKTKRADIEKFWRLAEQSIRNHEDVPTPPMTKIMVKHPSVDFSNMDLAEVVKEQLEKSRESYRDAKARGAEIRQEFLREQAEIAHLNGNITVENAILQLRHIEASIAVHSSLKIIMQKQVRPAGLSMIKIPNNEGGHDTIVDPKIIEEKLLERNKNHYAQSENTEMASDTVRELIGTRGTTTFCDEVLTGSANLSELSPTLRAIFKQLEKPSNITISDKITYEDFKDALKVWKEKTSTSPSGRHLGHYISLMTKIGNETDLLGEEMLELHHKMLIIAQYRQQPYERWKTETEIMLEKEPGNPIINRLRIICLYEADYNLYLKIMWAHRLVSIAEKEKLFDESQSGGRPCRTSNDVALRKMLTYTYSRVTRTNFACMDLDAKACFDRINASFGMLCSRYFGMPKEACELHGLTIAGMKHHVKTALGISSAFFQSSPERFLYGSGQGSSGSPPMWMAISQILFRTLEARVGHGAYYTCPRNMNVARHTTEGWVDDSTNFINDINSSEIWEENFLCEKIREQNQEWESILATSGGELELPKCLAYIVVYDFVNGEPTQRPKSSMTSEIFINGTTTNERTKIDIKDPAESHKTLGTHQNPASNPKGQAKILAEKELKMAAIFKHSKMPCYKTQLAYSSMYSKSIQFPLGVTFMNYELAEKISKRTTRAIIGAMHLNRSSPRVLAFTPPKLLGLGMRHHYTVQGTCHLKQIVQHLRQRDENGRLYKMILEHAQLLAGVPYQILQFPDRRLPHVTDIFITTVRKFLLECKGLNIVIMDLYIPRALRVNDINIMSAIMEIEKNDAAIRRFNQVRLFLQVTWLSEICNPSGTIVLSEFLHHSDRTDRHSQSILHWPIQEAPPYNSWRIWKSLLRKRFLRSKQGRLSNTTLANRLGPFIPVDFNHRMWKWEATGPDTIVENMFDQGSVVQREHRSETVTRHTQQITDSMDYEIQTTTKVGHPIELLLDRHVTKTLSKATGIINGKYNMRSENDDNNTGAPKSPSKYIKELTKFCNGPTFTTNQIILLQSKHKIIGVASKQWGERTDFGWCAYYRDETNDEIHRIGGGAGSVGVTTSFSERIHGELYAARAAINHMKKIFTMEWEKKKLRMTIITSNATTIQVMNHRWKTTAHNPRWRLNRNWELLTGITDDLGKQRLNVEAVQKDQPSHEIILDDVFVQISKFQQLHVNTPPQLQPIQKLGIAYLMYGHKIVNERFDEEISMRYMWHQFTQHVMKKFKWSTKTLESIDWEAFQHEAKKQTINRRTHLLKYVYEWLPIGTMLQRINSAAPITCPSCDAPIEEPLHMFTCTKAERQLITTECIEAIVEIFNKRRAGKGLTNSLKVSLNFWRNHPKQYQPTYRVHHELREAWNEQQLIGWNNLFKGFISTKFRAILNKNKDGPMNKFEQIRGTCEIIDTVWSSEAEHWKHRNEDKFGHTPEEAATIEWDNLLLEAAALFTLKTQIPRKHRSKLFPKWARITTKRTSNLAIWIKTTRRSVEYLLDVGKQADDDPNNAGNATVPSLLPAPD